MEVVEEGGDTAVWINAEWISPETKTYQCWVYLTPEESGGFSVFASLLPGVVSQGKTKEDALDNITEAFRGVVEEYQASDQPIPWSKEAFPKPNNAQEQWILVNA